MRCSICNGLKHFASHRRGVFINAVKEEENKDVTSQQRAQGAKGEGKKGGGKGSGKDSGKVQRDENESEKDKKDTWQDRLPEMGNGKVQMGR